MYVLFTAAQPPYKSAGHVTQFLDIVTRSVAIDYEERCSGRGGGGGGGGGGGLPIFSTRGCVTG